MQNVTKDREKYIGGSDVPIIMGLSPFRTRFDLLLEKAGVKEVEIVENQYTEYGNEMEAKIREYVSNIEKIDFKEDKIIKGDMRYHADGYGNNVVLEIKTTSHENHDMYMAQLLTGMMMYECQFGILAIYDRPKDFDTEFDPDRLKMELVDRALHEDYCQEIWQEIDKFRSDLEQVKANPFITEEELLPKEIIEYANEIAEMETQIATYKLIEARYKKLKSDLKEAMETYGVKKWTTNNGTLITLVADGEDKMVKKFDEKLFKEENPELHEKYLTDTIQKGKSGYVRITVRN